MPDSFARSWTASSIDWEKWDLKQCWARPEDYFAESQRNQAKLALDNYNIWMSDPALVGDLTSTADHRRVVPRLWYHELFPGTEAWYGGCL